jgi:hypothetical protein
LLQDAEQQKALADVLPSAKRAKTDDGASVAPKAKNTLESKMELEERMQ